MKYWYLYNLSVNGASVKNDVPHKARPNLLREVTKDMQLFNEQNAVVEMKVERLDAKSNRVRAAFLLRTFVK